MSAFANRKKYPTPAAAEFLDVEPCTMESWRCFKKGPPYYKVSGSIFYFEDDLEKFLAASRVEPTAAPRRGRGRPRKLLVGEVAK
jgi:hypothetical protein